MRIQSLGSRLLFVACITVAFAVIALSRSAEAQTTVQLPTFNTFRYSGSVLVPTGGSTSLGGVSRSASGRTSRRGGGRGFGENVGHAGAQAHVTIIDNDAIDRQIRGLPPKGSGGSTTTNPHGQAAPATPNRLSVAQQERRDASVDDPDAEGKALVRFARKQYLAGKPTSSFDAYRLAIDSLSPRLAQLAEAEFHRVFPSKQRPVHFLPQQLAAQEPMGQPGQE